MEFSSEKMFEIFFYTFYSVFPKGFKLSSQLFFFDIVGVNEEISVSSVETNVLLFSVPAFVFSSI